MTQNNVSTHLINDSIVKNSHNETADSRESDVMSNSSTHSSSVENPVCELINAFQLAKKHSLDALTVLFNSECNTDIYRLEQENLSFAEEEMAFIKKTFETLLTKGAMSRDVYDKLVGDETDYTSFVTHRFAWLHDFNTERTIVQVIYIYIGFIVVVYIVC